MKRAGAIVLAVLAAGCASSSAVTRSVGGRLVRGRFVTDDAYAAYLRGALLEAQGKREAALGAYLEGARQDPESPELLTRIGALSCNDKEDATTPQGRPGNAFDRAAAIDPAYEEAWTERARCQLKRGRLADAEDAARAAISLDPDRIEAYEALLAFAERTSDEPRRIAATRALADLGARADRRPFEKRARITLRDVDGALARGAFDEARRLALSARISSGALALRAAAIGAASFARDQAELVLAADPSDGDARIAAVVSADLLRDDDALARAMTGVRTMRARPSPLARALMAELLERRVGKDAKKAWLDAIGGTSLDEGDALTRDVATRQ